MCLLPVMCDSGAKRDLFTHPFALEAGPECVVLLAAAQPKPGGAISKALNQLDCTGRRRDVESSKA